MERTMKNVLRCGLTGVSLALASAVCAACGDAKPAEAPESVMSPAQGSTPAPVVVVAPATTTTTSVTTTPAPAPAGTTVTQSTTTTTVAH
jgi:hypothetical protein